MKVKIKTLTPVHIGTGKKLGDIEFFNNYRIDYDKLFELIAEEKQEEFFNWIDQNPRITVRDIQSKFSIKNQDIISKCGLYSFNGSIQRELNEGIKDSEYKLFIPGSTLKGSLRTALMFKVLSKNISLVNDYLDHLQNQTKEYYSNFLNQIEEIKNNCKNENTIVALIDNVAILMKSYQLKAIKTLIQEFEKNNEKGKNKYETIIKRINKAISSIKDKFEKLKANADEDIIKEVFICGVEKTKNNRTEIVYDDQKYDLMKLIKISDTTSVSTKDDGEITELQVYALKKIPAHKTFKTYTESLKENVELEFDISIDIEFLKKAKIELDNSSYDFGKKYFIGIESKLKDLFEIDIKNDTEFSEERIIKSIIDSWINFGNTVSNLEKKWVDSISNKNNANITNLTRLYESTNKFKIGFGTGFSGMTILSLLLGDETLKKKTFEFYKSVGIGFHNSNKSPLIINEFPFTRKYSKNQNIYGGFGWAKFQLNGESEKNTNIQNESISSTKISKPQNSVLAEIINDQSKPPKVKILEGEHTGKETILPGVRLEGVGLSKGSQVFVKLIIDKKTLQKAEFKGKK